MNQRLAHSPADIIAYALTSMGKGTLPESNGDWPVNVGSERSKTDSVITVYDTVGRDSGRLQLTGERLVAHGVQVRVQSSSQRSAYEKIQDIAIDFDELVYQYYILVTHTTGEEFRYLIHNIQRTTQPYKSPPDQSAPGRAVYTFNALAKIYRYLEDDDIPGGYLLLENSNHRISLGAYASKPISELEELTTPAANDEFAIHDVSTGETKKIRYSNVSSGGGGVSTFEAENKEGSTIVAGGACATHSSGTGVVKAIATGTTKPCIGLAIAEAANAMSVTVQTGGPLTLEDWTDATGSATLTKGPYYVDPSNNGKITSTVPTTGVLQQVGYATATDTLVIEIEPSILL